MLTGELGNRAVVLPKFVLGHKTCLKSSEAVQLLGPACWGSRGCKAECSLALHTTSVEHMRVAGRQVAAAVHLMTGPITRNCPEPRPEANRLAVASPQWNLLTWHSTSRFDNKCLCSPAHHRWLCLCWEIALENGNWRLPSFHRIPPNTQRSV